MQLAEMYHMLARTDTIRCSTGHVGHDLVGEQATCPGLWQAEYTCRHCDLAWVRSQKLTRDLRPAGEIINEITRRPETNRIEPNRDGFALKRTA